MSRLSSTGSSGTGARVRGTRGPAAGLRTLHLDAFSGIAGNMFLGALLDLGLPRKQLEEGLSGLGVEFSLRVKRVQRGALAARHVDVRVPGAPVRGKAQLHDHATGSHSVTSHSHAGEAHDHAGTAHSHRGKKRTRGAAAHTQGRSYKQITQLLRKARLDADVRKRALAIFDGEHVVSLSSRKRLEILPNARVIIDHQDAEPLGHGSSLRFVRFVEGACTLRQRPESPGSHGRMCRPQATA
jgi:hypothetical protein